MRPNIAEFIVYSVVETELQSNMERILPVATVVVSIYTYIQVHDNVGDKLDLVSASEGHAGINPAFVSGEPLGVETINANDSRQLAVVHHFIELSDDISPIVLQEISVEFCNLWKRNCVALALRNKRFVWMDIVRSQPFPLLYPDSIEQFFMDHIIHFPLPSADPSVPTVNNR